MTGKGCCILFNQPRDGALPDELDVLDQVEFVETNLNKIGIKTFRKGITSDFMNEIELLAKEKPDFVFNLVESIINKGFSDNTSNLPGHFTDLKPSSMF